MQFKALFVFALPVFAAPAAELVARDDVSAATYTSEDPVANVGSAALMQKREIVAGPLAQAAGNAIAAAAAAYAVNEAVKLIKNLSGWTDAREKFTQQTVKTMIDKNPDSSKYVAAICYNMGYSLKDPKGMTGKTSVSLKSGVLKTDYDCFYMTAGNAFYSEGDGGYINLAIQSYTGKCTYDSKTSDLTC